ncbi:TPA: helix-turn-helix domain-containing protein [Klebsiella pneumoniae]|uniref:helix-turn-helix domain-containing protein n=1 Tax=Klebsiella pneumoniae TaxID=573 RepID=UPI000E2B9BD2|nr:helix-turn-helix domain-containing protein [Klebsiella pneumoniae]MCA5497513.1 transcriptional regulator [Klebsiella pneumoniae]MCA5508264.1 transcriptional regulator [Klebsiella pneumoniae]MCQ0510517.1 transcriptional regulator [Klebsiella pneumoniae]MCU8720569.1 transcriptional regulator [Klebsiella pneumoniae]MEC7321224.1 transcriptional regulator [Klebsiella pneumoniae]
MVYNVDMNKEKNLTRPPLADRLYVLMKRSGVNKSGLARICGITPQAAGKWFITGNISKDSAIKIAEAFSVSLSWLLGDETSDSSLPESYKYTPDAIDERQQTLLQLFDRLPESEKDKHIQSLKMMVDNYDKLFTELLKNRNLEEIIQAKKGE